MSQFSGASHFEVPGLNIIPRLPIPPFHSNLKSGSG